MPGRAVTLACCESQYSRWGQSNMAHLHAEGHIEKIRIRPVGGRNYEFLCHVRGRKEPVSLGRFDHFGAAIIAPDVGLTGELDYATFTVKHARSNSAFHDSIVAAPSGSIVVAILEQASLTYAHVTAALALAGFDRDRQMMSGEPASFVGVKGDPVCARSVCAPLSDAELTVPLPLEVEDGFAPTDRPSITVRAASWASPFSLTTAAFGTQIFSTNSSDSFHLLWCEAGRDPQALNRMDNYRSFSTDSVDELEAKLVTLPEGSAVFFARSPSKSAKPCTAPQLRKALLPIIDEAVPPFRESRFIALYGVIGLPSRAQIRQSHNAPQSLAIHFNTAFGGFEERPARSFHLGASISIPPGRRSSEIAKLSVAVNAQEFVLTETDVGGIHQLHIRRTNGDILWWDRYDPSDADDGAAFRRQLTACPDDALVLILACNVKPNVQSGFLNGIALLGAREKELFAHGTFALLSDLRDTALLLDEIAAKSDDKPTELTFSRYVSQRSVPVELRYTGDSWNPAGASFSVGLGGICPPAVWNKGDTAIILSLSPHDPKEPYWEEIVAQDPEQACGRILGILDRQSSDCFIILSLPPVLIQALETAPAQDDPEAPIPASTIHALAQTLQTQFGVSLGGPGACAIAGFRNRFGHQPLRLIHASGQASSVNFDLSFRPAPACPTLDILSGENAAIVWTDPSSAQASTVISADGAHDHEGVLVAVFDTPTAGIADGAFFPTREAGWEQKLLSYIHEVPVGQSVALAMRGPVQVFKGAEPFKRAINLIGGGAMLSSLVGKGADSPGTTIASGYAVCGFKGAAPGMARELGHHNRIGRHRLHVAMDGVPRAPQFNRISIVLPDATQPDSIFELNGLHYGSEPGESYAATARSLEFLRFDGDQAEGGYWSKSALDKIGSVKALQHLGSFPSGTLVALRLRPDVIGQDAQTAMTHLGSRKTATQLLLQGTALISYVGSDKNGTPYILPVAETFAGFRNFSARAKMSAWTHRDPGDTPLVLCLETGLGYGDKPGGTLRGEISATPSPEREKYAQAPGIHFNIFVPGGKSEWRYYPPSDGVLDQFGDFVSRLSAGTVVAVRCLAPGDLCEWDKKELQSLGSAHIRDVKPGGYLSFIGYRGAPPGSIPECFNNEGPATCAVLMPPVTLPPVKEKTPQKVGNGHRRILVWENEDPDVAAWIAKAFADLFRSPEQAPAEPDPGFEVIEQMGNGSSVSTQSRPLPQPGAPMQPDSPPRPAVLPNWEQFMAPLAISGQPVAQNVQPTQPSPLPQGVPVLEPQPPFAIAVMPITTIRPYIPLGLRRTGRPGLVQGTREIGAPPEGLIGRPGLSFLRLRRMKSRKMRAHNSARRILARDAQHFEISQLDQLELMTYLHQSGLRDRRWIRSAANPLEQARRLNSMLAAFVRAMGARSRLGPQLPFIMGVRSGTIPRLVDSFVNYYFSGLPDDFPLQTPRYAATGSDVVLPQPTAGGLRQRVRTWIYRALLQLLFPAITWEMPLRIEYAGSGAPLTRGTGISIWSLITELQRHDFLPARIDERWIRETFFLEWNAGQVLFAPPELARMPIPAPLPQPGQPPVPAHPPRHILDLAPQPVRSFSLDSFLSLILGCIEPNATPAEIYDYLMRPSTFIQDRPGEPRILAMGPLNAAAILCRVPIEAMFADPATGRQSILNLLCRDHFWFADTLMALAATGRLTGEIAADTRFFDWGLIAAQYNHAPALTIAIRRTNDPTYRPLIAYLTSEQLAGLNKDTLRRLGAEYLKSVTRPADNRTVFYSLPQAYQDMLSAQTPPVPLAQALDGSRDLPNAYRVVQVETWLEPSDDGRMIMAIPINGKRGTSAHLEVFKKLPSLHPYMPPDWEG